MTWDPVAPRDTVRLELECSRDGDGKAAAAVLFRPWSGRERLAYEDAVTTSLLTRDVEGGHTIRLGTLKALHATLTVVAWEGFPDEITLADTITAENPRGEREAFDLRQRRHLEALDPAVVEEIASLARTVEPLPTAPGTSAAPADDVVDEDGAGESAEDPSPTPSTRPARRRPRVIEGGKATG